jgi:hypothetical protein
MMSFDYFPEDNFVCYDEQPTFEQVNSFSSFLTFQVDVTLHYIPNQDKEFISNLKVSTTANGDIYLQPLCETLKSLNFPLSNSTIFYYSNNTGAFHYVGNDPLPQQAIIPSTEYSTENGRKAIIIRARPVEQPDLPRLEPDLELEAFCLVERPPVSDNTEFSFDDSDSSSDEKAKRRRHKERKIGEVLDLVLRWRKLYSGVRDYKTGQIVKLSLEDAAKRLGVAKKSLDDYLLQIRFARKFGYNFQENSNERVGVLRAYVKNIKNGDKTRLSVLDVKEENDSDFSEPPKISKKSKKIQKCSF